MLQAMWALVDDYQTTWLNQLPLVEFAMNSSISASTGHAPFELNYSWIPRMIKGPEFNAPREGVKLFVQNIKDILDKTFDKLITQRTCQATKANKHRREGQGFKVGDLMFLSTENLSLLKGRARKLTPKCIGPYKVLEAKPSSSTYKIELPPDLKA
jgi:hypothetical protein